MVRWLWKGLTYKQGLKTDAFLGSALQQFKRYNVNIFQNDRYSRYNALNIRCTFTQLSRARLDEVLYYLLLFSAIISNLPYHSFIGTFRQEL